MTQQREGLLSPHQLAALKDIFHQGSLQASAAMAKWLSRSSVIELDSLEQLPLEEATGILGEAGQAFDRVVGRLFYGRADGGFVRVSTRIEDADLSAARARIEPFARQLDTLLAQHWPEEVASKRL